MRYGELEDVLGATSSSLLSNRLEDLADAGSWSTRVGVVSAAPDRAEAFVSRVGLEPAFVASLRGEADGLAVPRRQYPTARHVLVGATDPARRAARSLGWEYLDHETAAAEAGWRLAAEADRWRGGGPDG